MSVRSKRSVRLKTGHTLPQALAIARDLTKKQLYEIGDSELANELAELGYLGDEAMNKALLIALSEVTPENYHPPAEPHENPGIPFVWNSICFEKRMYLKFKIKGTKHKPTLWWYSCHEAHF